ncbi:MAG: aminopeptidase [Acidimicrobiia bacterium]|nr:aminopeptidase [Acidimicrobiia bacterium]
MSDPVFANVLERCLGVQRGEDIVLLVDEGTDAEVIAVFRDELSRRRCTPVVAAIPVPELPGSEPPRPVAAAMRQADAVIELTSLFIGSNRARRDATAAGVRYLAMPGVKMSTFRDGGPLAVDFDQLRAGATEVGDAWTEASEFRLTTPAGTDLRGSVAGRPGRVLHGVCRGVGEYMAPPDVEAGTAPVEGTTEGVVVVDADFLFMGVGPLPEPVTLTFAAGELVDIDGHEGERLREMIDRCDDPRMSNLAEVSLGLNPAGLVCDVAMETESALGTAHIAVGNSIAYGGTVDARAHLDCVMRDASLELDGNLVMSCGHPPD